jgi:hypothetical protein
LSLLVERSASLRIESVWNGSFAFWIDWLACRGVELHARCYWETGVRTDCTLGLVVDEHGSVRERIDWHSVVGVVAVGSAETSDWVEGETGVRVEDSRVLLARRIGGHSRRDVDGDWLSVSSEWSACVWVEGRVGGGLASRRVERLARGGIELAGEGSASARTEGLAGVLVDGVEVASLCVDWSAGLGVEGCGFGLAGLGVDLPAGGGIELACMLHRLLRVWIDGVLRGLVDGEWLAGLRVERSASGGVEGLRDGLAGLRVDGLAGERVEETRVDVARDRIVWLACSGDGVLATSDRIDGSAVVRVVLASRSAVELVRIGWSRMAWEPAWDRRRTCSWDPCRRERHREVCLASFCL